MKIGIYIIIGMKNQEKEIDSVLGSLLFKIMYGKEEKIKKVILTDLDSTDKTMQKLQNYKTQDNNVKVTTWKKCKDIIDLIDDS